MSLGTDVALSGDFHLAKTEPLIPSPEDLGLPDVGPKIELSPDLMIESLPPELREAYDKMQQNCTQMKDLFQEQSAMGIAMMEKLREMMRAGEVTPNEALTLGVTIAEDMQDAALETQDFLGEMRDALDASGLPLGTCGPSAPAPAPR